MDIREHLLYQELLVSQYTLADALRTFEKVISDTGVASLDDLRRQAADDGEVTGDGADTTDPAGRKYGALVIQTVFSSFADEQIRDFINLAHKEALARRISLLLHTDEVDLRRVETEVIEFTKLPVGRSQVSPNISMGIRVQLISSFVSDDLFYIGVAKNFITMRDTAALITRFIGKFGQRCRVGGKSAGMILANRILKPAYGDATGFEADIDEVDSYFLTAQVFNRFVEYNRLEEGHSLKYLEVDEREYARSELEGRFYRGVFPEDVDIQIREMLDALGDGPLIVRSSSLLEDNMGFPFYGKHESVFISNQGRTEERYEQLIHAIRRVYVSILASSVIEYRKDKDLLDYDDMMAVLVQRVVGKRYGKYYFPETAGVAFSRNQYCWSRRIQHDQGVARTVFGLGTRAVERSGDDYPRLVSLSQPELRPEGTLKEKLKYSQRFVDVLNLESGEIESVHFVDLYNYIRTEVDPTYQPSEALSLVDDDRLVTPVLFPSSLVYGSAAITFDGLLEHSRFPRLMNGVLKFLENAFGVPVDVEFACQDDKLYILQCRPLAEFVDDALQVEIPAPTRNQIVLFEASRDIFRSARMDEIRYIVNVDGETYHALGTPAEKLEVARTVGRINRQLKGSRFIIMGPGRWGSVNIELGVKVTYSDINNAKALIEVATEMGGYTPEVSYGTHFFQDLVEANIVPLPIYPAGGGALNVEFLRSAPSVLRTLIPEKQAPPEWMDKVVSVIDLDVDGTGLLSVYLDSIEARGIGLVG